VWAARIVRQAAKRNPLCRPVDRIQVLLTLVLVLSMLLIAPVAGWWAARAAYHEDLRASAWEREHRFPVMAVVLEDPAGSSGGQDEGPRVEPVLAQARWTGPNGVVRTGMITADAQVRPGSVVQVWVDEHGVQVSRPVPRSAPADAAMAALLAAGGIAAGLCGVRLIVVWRLDRRRLRAWQAEWAVVGPRWGHR